MVGQERKADTIEEPPLDLGRQITKFLGQRVTPHQPIAHSALHPHGRGVYLRFAAHRPELLWHLCPHDRHPESDV